MNAQHTPGPWHVEPLQTSMGADMAICARLNGWVVAVVQHDPDIQRVDEPDGDSVIWHDADKANAAIIAEAPAMLDAIRLQLQAADEGDADKSMNAFDAFRAILARIEGDGHG